jgi:hypothetical protein
MIKKSVWCLYIFALLVVFVTIGYRCYQYIDNRNFVLEVNTICDPQIEKCFVQSSDFGFLETPYKKVTIVASLAPRCLEEHTCEAFFCPTDLKNAYECQTIYCSDETKKEGEECSGESIDK